ncbi:hypothetical protein [Blastococcus brunescens]|uniref:Membrane transport protein MMPL domain-containing protein n=1 Tax=Blastococcus brunescens TaxID=1564165 RepID=A0ABZ1B6D2_9ACTN|nr:hypothetical protein [Blastococcus sp. BMG 8361]WRL65927.1 hypothetical protein U6N30_10450 [Blastococcus sp. BMG 8361]
MFGTPLLAAVVGVAGQRRVLTSPLGVTRQSRPAAAGWWRLVVLAVGLGLLGGGYLAQLDLLSTGSWLFGALLITGMVLTLLGLALSGATLARLIGALMARLAPGPAGQLAGRRLMMDPGAAGRAIAGTSLVVAVAGFVLAFLPVLEQARTGYLAEQAEPLQPGTLFVTTYLEGIDLSPAGQLTSADVDRLSAVPGVDAVVVLPQVGLLAPGGDLSPERPRGRRTSRPRRSSCPAERSTPPCASPWTPARRGGAGARCPRADSRRGAAARHLSGDRG